MGACRLKPQALSPRRPVDEITLDANDSLDAELLPEYRWEEDNQNDGGTNPGSPMDQTYRHIQKDSRVYCQMEGYVDPEWIPLSQLNCGALLYDFNQGSRARARFKAMQTGDDYP
ncbi:LOW QUALITY PROTEIN: hypothetical protein PHMEG_0005394 [Phytophthora megakarya]|uniref:Uncharacterized protein n=1 Tax=Phytophthora megakarya TaxID=4795 RepID=A0A225WT01_9STRA|nr:LOW QUALITY PROTEIN: hypothetical protein PHMEG_0005394 [Phytophthora megakarya]